MSEKMSPPAIAVEPNVWVLQAKSSTFIYIMFRKMSPPAIAVEQNIWDLQIRPSCDVAIDNI